MSLKILKLCAERRRQFSLNYETELLDPIGMGAHKKFRSGGKPKKGPPHRETTSPRA